MDQKKPSHLSLVAPFDPSKQKQPHERTMEDTLAALAVIPDVTWHRIRALQQAEEANSPLTIVAKLREERGEPEPTPNAALVGLADRLRRAGLPEPIPMLVGPVPEDYLKRLTIPQLEFITDVMCEAFKKL